MNRDQFESQWDQIRDTLRDRWGSLTDEDLRQIHGRYDQLIAKLQLRYGYSREQAEDEVRKWSADRPIARQYREDETIRTQKSESASLFPWLVAAGIPLLVLASYLMHESTKPNEEYATPKPVSREMTAGPQDQAVTQNVRKALMDNNMPTIRIITSDGVVTVSGPVATEQERTNIVRIVEDVEGVREVNDQLETR